MNNTNNRRYGNYRRNSIGTGHKESQNDIVKKYLMAMGYNESNGKWINQSTGKEVTDEIISKAIEASGNQTNMNNQLTINSQKIKLQHEAQRNQANNEAQRNQGNNEGQRNQGNNEGQRGHSQRNHHDNNHRHRGRNGVDPIGSFYGANFIVDGGNTDLYGRTIPINMNGKGIPIPGDPYGRFQLETRTGFATSSAQAYAKAGIIQMPLLQAPLINQSTTTPLQAMTDLSGLPSGYSPAYGANATNGQIPLVIPDEPNIPSLYQQSGYIPISYATQVQPINYTTPKQIIAPRVRFNC